jgi:hypothetical protein
MEGSLWMERLWGGLAVVGSGKRRWQSARATLRAIRWNLWWKRAWGNKAEAWLPFIGVGRQCWGGGDGRPSGGGALSRGGQLQERRWGDWRRVMRENEGHGTSDRFVHWHEEKGDGRRLHARRRLGCLEVGEDPIGSVWAKRPKLGRLRVENKRKNNWAAQGVLGRNWFSAVDRNRNCFRILSQGIGIQIRRFRHFQNEFEQESN